VIDPIDYLWPLLEAHDPTVGAHTVARWPQGGGNRLIEIGLLRRTDRARWVQCPECRNHYEEVLAIEGPGGTKRFFIPCPEVLRAEIEPSLLDQWMASSDSLVAMLTKTLSLQGKCVALVSGRLWRLGRTQWQGSLRDVLFTRGLHWSDAAKVRSEIVRCKKPIIFVPKVQPPDSFWKTPPVVIPLTDVATFSGDQLEIDPMEIVAAIQNSKSIAASAMETSLSLDDMRGMIRQQIKAEHKTAISDDLLLAAYRTQGSVRKAAEYLSEQTGTYVTKDKVNGALQRSGGASAVANPDDSSERVATGGNSTNHGGMG
jgi:hypothetical protein